MAIQVDGSFLVIEADAVMIDGDHMDPARLAAAARSGDDLAQLAVAVIRARRQQQVADTDVAVAGAWLVRPLGPPPDGAGVSAILGAHPSRSVRHASTVHLDPRAESEGDGAGGVGDGGTSGGGEAVSRPVDSGPGPSAGDGRRAGHERVDPRTGRRVSVRPHRVRRRRD